MAQGVDDDSTFTYAEMRVALTAMLLWLGQQQGTPFVNPTAMVDQFLAETT